MYKIIFKFMNIVVYVFENYSYFLNSVFFVCSISFKTKRNKKQNLFFVFFLLVKSKSSFQKLKKK